MAYPDYGTHLTYSKAYAARQRAEDPEGVRAYQREWAKANPDKIKAYQHRQYLRRKTLKAQTQAPRS